VTGVQTCALPICNDDANDNDDDDDDNENKPENKEGE
jgi:hypothetical protein